MSDDSGDCSDIDPRPSASGSKSHSRAEQKRKRRIVMRIEFDSSDEDMSSASCASASGEDDLDLRPSTSKRSRGKGRPKTQSTASADKSISHIEDLPSTAKRQLRNRRGNLNVEDSNLDYSSSGSEIIRRVKTCGKVPKKLVVSEEEREQQSPQEDMSGPLEDAGCNSDSSSNELLEKCPICLFTFRRQEIGCPATCAHIFCASCIEAWSKNVQTCPIDRLVFDKIIVRNSFENRTIMREVNVDPNKCSKELLFEDFSEEEEEEVTHCELCNRPDREDVMLLCDSCNAGYHIFCLIPPLTEIPEQNWYCDNCVDSQADSDGDLEDLNMLYEDIRDMGIPEACLSVTEVHQPRMLRTRQNERIRAAILRVSRSRVPHTETTTTTTTTTRSTRGRPRTTTTTTTRTTRNRSTTKTRRKPRSRRARQRTYVVEYDLNKFDEKFAIKTKKKIIRRRKRKQRSARRSTTRESTNGRRAMAASKRLAEQLGVKKDPNCTSYFDTASAGLSIFGNPNGLEYFSDSDHGGIESEIEFASGHGTAVQSSVRISNFGSLRSRKGLLLGRLQRSPRAIPAPVPPVIGAPDLLSNILDIQDRWHNASRNLENVRINTDGTLKFEDSSRQQANPDSNSIPAPSAEQRSNTEKSQTAHNNSSPSDVTQAPMYPRGGGNPNFNSNGGGSYNNRFSNQNSYQGGGNQYRHSTGGMMSGGGSGVGGSGVGGGGGVSDGMGGGGGNFNNNMPGPGSFNFNNPNYNPNPNSNFSPFSIRFNQRNQLNNNQRNNQRNSLPFINRNDTNMHNQQNPNYNPHQQQLNPEVEANLFAGLPPPISHPPPIQPDPIQLFGALPPVMGNQVLRSQSLEPPQNMLSNPVSIPPVLSVPPPPAPPPGVQIPWNNSLFQLTTEYGNDDDDDSNCPNFSVYSAESQEVAKSTEINTIEDEAPKEDDENEDLVQLDDDDEIPMPPEISATPAGSGDLYEPENPTEEMEYEAEPEQNIEETEPVEHLEASANVDTEITDATDIDQYDPEHETFSQSERIEEDASKNDQVKLDQSNEDSKSINDREGEIDESTPENSKNSKNSRTPSPALSEIKLPESETSVANRKGVLELYDDSDWEELEIDRPKGYEKVEETEKEIEAEIEEAAEPISSIDAVSEITNEAVAEPDRSYTPCLDENNEPEEAAGSIAAPQLELAPESPVVSEQADSVKNSDDVEEVPGIAGMETELISDEDENSRGRNKRRGDKRDKRDKHNSESFKKVSHKQKERNYRNEKQMPNRRMDNRRQRDRFASYSHSSRSKSRTKSRTKSKSKSRSRSRSRSWSQRVGRGRKRSASLRSRSRSPYKENKENYNWRQGRRGGFFNNARFFHRQRPKRRELPRYDVRNVIGAQRHFKDRYGRDASRQVNSRSFSRGRRPRTFSRSRSHSVSPKRNRRCSFSISPTPPPVFNRQSMSPRRFVSPRRRSHSHGRTSPVRPHSRSPPRIRSCSVSPVHRMNGRKVKRHLHPRSPIPRVQQRSRSQSLAASPRYTPRLSKSRSRSPFERPKGKKKKNKDKKKKKAKKRAVSITPVTNRRISRQQDPFEHPKKKRRHSPKIQSPVEEPTWSPSPSPPPVIAYQHDNNMSWTPPIMSPRVCEPSRDVFQPDTRRSESKSSKKEKRKRAKKKKKGEKRREGRKEKRRQRRTQTPEPIPSKEVFASGNNILVSVSFNKEGANQQGQQTTVVTLPPTREAILMNRRTSVDAIIASNAARKKKDKAHKRKKLDTKPIAIIDLERSPFQVHQEPADIIVLSDSEDGNDNLHEDRRERLYSESGAEDIGHHHSQITNSGRPASQHDKTPPVERLDTILEESYDIPQTGPKTPPEPPLANVKFNLITKKQTKPRNPLHDEPEETSELELEEREDEEEEQLRQEQHRQEQHRQEQHRQEQHRQEQHRQEQHRQELDTMHIASTQKIGPNTPPESGPCSPDAYDPFEPTKSPSISPRSPTPPPLDVSQPSIGDSEDLVPTQKVIPDEPRVPERVQKIPVSANSIGSQTATLNPVELVMALMNSKANTSQDLANKSNESQFSSSTNILANAVAASSAAHEDNLNMRDKPEEAIAVTVLSNVLLSTGGSQATQHIPIISSPAPIVKSTQIMKLPLPKVGGSVGSSSGTALPPITLPSLRNGGLDDSFNINDIDSPYSPGSADYEDLFDPPPETSTTKRRSKRNTNNGGKLDVFDNLFGSSSPVGHLRLPSYTPSSRKQKTLLGLSVGRKSKLKGKDIYDELPNSAVDLQVKDKFLRKLNRQERVVEEVKMVLKPRFNKKQISKDDYKEIMRRAVPKICHSRSGEINPHKIKNLIEAYVKKFRAKHKKLNIINTGQVSSAVKCAAYLKKL